MSTSIASLVQSIDILGVYTNALDLSTPSERIAVCKKKQITNGTGANQSNRVWHDQRPLVATSENLDLTDGTLIDAFGNTLAFTKIKTILVHNLSTTSGEDITLSGNFFENDMFGGSSPTFVLGPDGVFFASSPVDGFAVTASTGDVLTVDAGSDTITYDIVLIGTV